MAGFCRETGRKAHQKCCNYVRLRDPPTGRGLSFGIGWKCSAHTVI